MTQGPLTKTTAYGVPPRLDLEGLFRAHAAQVARWAGLLGGRGVDVDDVVQEVFVTAHRKVEELTAAGLEAQQLRVWLYRATAHIVKRRRRHERIRAWLAGAPDDFAASVPTNVPSPLESMVTREESRRVHQILDDMPERYRTVLVLFELEGLSGEEIALYTGLKLGTVWVQLHRARDLFLKRLTEIEGKAASA